MNIALLLSGGLGSRLGADIPKQYIKVNEKMILSYCLETILLHNQIDVVQIVADEKWHDEIIEFLSVADKEEKFKGFSMPGINRQLSILNGLEDISKYAKESDVVLVHDGARPFLSSDLITECLTEIQGHDGVLPILPMKDTVYVSSDGYKVSALLKREEIYAGQAPECFILGKYLEANKRLLPNKILNINGSTEPAILAGMDIVMIKGDENNFKITTKADLDRFREILKG